MRQTFEVIANDFGIVRVSADPGVDSELGSDEIKIFGLKPGQAVELTILAGTANLIEGGHP